MQFKVNKTNYFPHNVHYCCSSYVSQIRHLWLPPITTRGLLHQRTNRFFRTSIPTTPCLGLITRTGVSHHLDYLNSVLSVFCLADITERLFCLFFCCLPGLFTYSGRLLPAFDPACLVYLLCYLFAACLNPLPPLRL